MIASRNGRQPIYGPQDSKAFAELARGVGGEVDADDPSMLAELAVSLFAWPTRSMVFEERLHSVAHDLLAQAYALAPEPHNPGETF